MKILRASTAIIGVLGCMWAAISHAQVRPHDDVTVVTKGTVQVNGKTLHYTATAGQIPLYVADTGERMATMFYVAYTADGAASAHRPITFIWNGGPGSSSSQLHVVGLGPKRLNAPDQFPEWPSGKVDTIVDNPETWLETSDLVFVDPPGTGYSRATTKEYRDILYTTRGDAEAVAELIRIYLTRNNRWISPLFILGESYGTTRAMAVANALEFRRTHLNGVLLVSGGFDVGQHLPPALSTALSIAPDAATGHFQGVLAPDLQTLPRDEAVKAAVDWARNVYAPALERLAGLSDQDKEGIAQGLHRYTGIDPKFVNSKTLSMDEYEDDLLRNRSLELGRYDGRMTTRYRGDGVVWLPWRDPSLNPLVDNMEGTSFPFNVYMRDILKFKSDLLYHGPWGKAFHPEPLDLDENGFGSDWMTRMFIVGDYNVSPTEMREAREARDPGEAERPPRHGAPALRRAMDLNPQLKVLSMLGMYDMHSSCARREAEIAVVEPALRARVTAKCYEGGHMWYSDRTTRVLAQHDFADFVRDATLKHE